MQVIMREVHDRTHPRPQGSGAELGRDCDWYCAVQEDDVGPLDAFMDAAVNPEVAAAEKAEAARKEAMRAEQVKALAVSTVVRPSSLHDSSTLCVAALADVNSAAS